MTEIQDGSKVARVEASHPWKPFEHDYLLRTIETVRQHRGADNCWPQWANIFADEIERCWKLLDAFSTRGVERDEYGSALKLMSERVEELEAQVAITEQERDTARQALTDVLQHQRAALSSEDATRPTGNKE